MILVGASGTMAVAAQTALPGDRLYPLKRGLESAHAQLTFDRAARGRVLLDSASTRLDEVAELSRTGASADSVSRTLDAFTQESIDGSDLLIADYQATGDQSSITTVRTFTAASMARLRLLQSAVPAGSVDQLLQAAQSLDQVQQVATRACPTCAGPSVTQVPTVLTQAVEAAADSWLVALPSGVRVAPRLRPGTRRREAPPGGRQPPARQRHRPHADGSRPGAPDRARRAAHPAAPHRRADRRPAARPRVDGHRHRRATCSTPSATSATRSPGTVGGTLDGLGSALPTDLPTLP